MQVMCSRNIDREVSTALALYQNEELVPLVFVPFSVLKTAKARKLVAVGYFILNGLLTLPLLWSGMKPPSCGTFLWNITISSGLKILI